MLKQAIEQDKNLWKKVVLLSNVFSNKLDDFINISDEEDVISHRQIENAASLQRLGIRTIKVASKSHIYKRALEKNRSASYFKKKDRATKKNGVAGCSDKEERIENVNGDISEINFFDQRIIRYNWQKKKKIRL